MARKVNRQFSHIVDAELVCVCRTKSGHIYKEGWRAVKPSDWSHRIEFICLVFFCFFCLVVLHKLSDS